MLFTVTKIYFIVFAHCIEIKKKSIPEIKAIRVRCMPFLHFGGHHLARLRLNVGIFFICSLADRKLHLNSCFTLCEL